MKQPEEILRLPVRYPAKWRRALERERRRRARKKGWPLHKYSLNQLFLDLIKEHVVNRRRGA